MLFYFVLKCYINVSFINLQYVYAYFTKKANRINGDLLKELKETAIITEPRLKIVTPSRDYTSFYYILFVQCNSLFICLQLSFRTVYNTRFTD